MSETLSLEIEKPKFMIGQRVVALINNQLREAHIEKAFLQVNIVVDDTGEYIDGGERWEYLVLVIADPIDASEKIVISEHTIIQKMDDALDDSHQIA